MKKLITIMAFFAVMATSCDVEENFYTPYRTQNGCTLFGFANVIVSDVAMLVSEMEQLNTYVRSDTVSRVILRQTEPWFIHTKIKQDAVDTTQWAISRTNEYGNIYGNHAEITMQDGLLLSEVGAKWSVMCDLPYMAVKNIACTMERTATDSLVVTFTDGWTRNEDYPFEFNNMVFVFAYDSTPKISLNDKVFIYTLSAEATCTSVGDPYVELTFTADKLLGQTAQRTDYYNRAYYPVYYKGGTLSAEMTRDGEEQSVEAKYKGENDFEIRYKGVTEKYHSTYAVEFYKGVFYW